MGQTAKDADLLRGKRVAFTGKLASLTRKEAADLVRTYGGGFVTTVNRQTSYLIVGQEGWPLRQDGRLTYKLLKARALQRRGHPVHVLSEAELLARLGLEARSDEICGLYTTAELVQLLKVPRDRLRAWMEAGLVKPGEIRDGVCYFDFRQVSAVKNLCKLTDSGVSVERIRRSLRQLSRWMPDVENSLSQLGALHDSKKLLLRSEEGHLIEPSGQIVFEFGEEPGPPSVEVGPRGRSPEQWFEDGCLHEQAGRLREAARSYRRGLLAGGHDPDICFNLANVLHALGKKEAAAERYRQAVEMKPSFAEAWNNLGGVLAELGEPEEAAAAYQRALTISPDLADAHYNLADILDEQRKRLEALPHWQAYLALEPRGRWADYARSRLFASGGQKRG